MNPAIQIIIRNPRQAGEQIPPGDIELPAGASRQLALDILQQGLAALPRGNGPAQRIVLQATSLPTLDDMLAATFAAHLAQGEELPKSAEVFAQYSALARGGYSPGRIPPDLTIEGIYHAICWPFGPRLADDRAATEFVHQWNRMAKVLWQAMLDGADPYTQPLFSEAGGFAREIVSLRSDRQVYEQDVKAGIRYRIHPAGTDTRENSALVLRDPKSLLFKQWARADIRSPSGDGYLVLGVQWDGGNWIFSTDPVQRLSLKALADALDEAEKERGASAAWFDGAPFQHSLVAAPKSGTTLRPAEVLAVFEKWAGARQASQASRASAAGNSRRAIAAVAALLVIVISWIAYQKMFGSSFADPSRSAVELDQLHVRSVKTKGATTAGNLALFVGVNEFRPGEFPRLSFAVDDAVAQAHLFIAELELIPPENAVLALQGQPGTNRGRKQLKALQALGVKPTEASRSDIIAALDRLQALPLPGGGLMIASFSTHGLDDAREHYLMLHDGMVKHPQEGAITVSELNSRMAQITVSKRLLFVDACRSTPQATSKAPPPKMSEGFLEALQSAKGQKVMASCAQGEASYEDTSKGHGIFTYWLLMGLKGGPTGASPDPRGMITIGTIQSFLQEKVPRYSRLNALGVQNPWFSADEGAESIPLAVPIGP
jgi:hypothetical protein